MRNYTLDLFKLLFIIIIAFHHTAWTSMTHGFLPVEFFFIVSGFFIYSSFKKSETPSVRHFMTHKCSRIFPTYWLALLIYILLYFVAPFMFYEDEPPSNFGFSVLRDLFCLQGVGLSSLLGLKFRLNASDWYVSTYLWGGLIVFMLLMSRKAIYVLPIIVLTVYTAFFIILDTSLDSEWGYHGFMYMPLWRGIAGMSIGALLGKLMSSPIWRNHFSRFIWFYNSLAIASCVAIGAILFADGNFEFLGIIAFVILLLNIISPIGMQKYFNRIGFIRYIPDISLEILLLHKFLIVVTVKIAEAGGFAQVEILKWALFVLILIASGFAFKRFVNLVQNGFRAVIISTQTALR